MVDVEWAMKQLGQVYRSEDHLKLSLAAELARMYGNERVRLEWNPSSGKQVDIGVRREDVTIPIELKYKTDEATVDDRLFGESFGLKRHGAHPHNHYLILRDVTRIEEIVHQQGRYGYVILLTNDSNYWTEPTNTASYDEFRIHEGRTLRGTLDWDNVSDWMERNGIDEPLQLSNEYSIEWTEFEYRDEISVSGNAQFRFVVLRIE